MDAGLTLALAGRPPSGDAPPEQAFDVTVLVERPLSASQVNELAELGVRADRERTVFAARTTRDSLQKLARKKCVARISLSQQLDYLKAAAAFGATSNLF